MGKVVSCLFQFLRILGITVGCTVWLVHFVLVIKALQVTQTLDEKKDLTFGSKGPAQIQAVTPGDRGREE